MKKIRLCIIGGGSRQWAIKFIKDLTVQDRISAHITLYDIDIEAARNNEIVANNIFKANGKDAHLSSSVALTLDEALPGSDFVIIAIEPGIIEIREADLLLPEEAGILQSVGDTTGPGGLMRAYRALPLFFDFARAIEKHAPSAWVINYTNPLTLCTAALYKAFPGIKAIGCCHEVFHTQEFIASFIAKERNIEIPDRREINLDVSGVNHFTFATSALYKGEDVMPVLKEYVKREDAFPDLTEKSRERAKSGKWFDSDSLVALSFLRDFGALGAAGDRHLAEFVPFFLTSDSNVFRYGFTRTPYSYRLEEDKRKKAKVYEGEDLIATRSSEEGVDILLALIGEGTLKTNINMINKGQVQYLPLGHIVESNGYISTDSIVPIVAENPPLSIQTMVKRIQREQEIALEAIWNGDSNLLFEAFMLDPLMRLAHDNARSLFDRMLKECALRYE